MEDRRLAVHRTIVVVDVEGFGDRRRTNRHQLAVREGLYRVMREAFDCAGIPWADCGHEDRGDGVFILVPAEVPKGLFVELLPSALVAVLRVHNDTHPVQERIRLRMALHAGEVHYDEHGVTAASINLAFRLLDAGELKAALAGSPGVLAVITSSWFFEEVVRHSAADSAAYRRVRVDVKESRTSGWICLPDYMYPPDDTVRERLPTVMAVPDRLALAYRATLTRPITPAGEVPAELQIPTLGEGYIDHRIRVAEVAVSSEPGRESWWNETSARDDACRFLAEEHLTSPTALQAPLLLLGQPGSGKSVLTRMLAARLPTTDFLPIRVELRQVPAEADLQDQIEFAIRNVTGERVPWPQLVESGDGALPVVMFDGFDELLQATGIAQTDFLLRVQAFQEREADQGRPLAVIVTSRIAVIDRARIPRGSVAVRLESFDEDQITRWLEVWKQFNAVPLAKRGMRPLPADIALNHQELAEQPLLLLMLALYDADTNALQYRSAELSQTELYGRLLQEFARREIRKHGGALPEADLKRAVDAELLRLSVVAFAMFNRRSQWVSEADLDADLSVLLDVSQDIRRTGGLHAPLTSAQVAIGRFFFVHESQATRDGLRLQTYEFLHATFGEFLVARLVFQVLTDVLKSERAAHLSLGGADDGLLHALLSFAALTARGPVVAFLGDLLEQMEARQRADLASLLLLLHARALYPRAASAYSGYEPLALTVPARHAAWSANLVVLTVLAAGELTGAQLFPHEPDVGMAWRNRAMMWRSLLSYDEWQGLHETIALKRVWDGDRRGIRLWRNDGTFIPPSTDIYWMYKIPPGHPGRDGIFTDQYYNSRVKQSKINFACNMSEDTMNYGLMPIDSSFPTLAEIFVTLDTDRPVSATRALVAALVAPYEDSGSTETAFLDLALVAGKLAQASNVKRDYLSYLKTALAVLIAAVEHGDASPACLESLAKTIGNGISEDAKLAQLLVRLNRLLSDHGVHLKIERL
jgi:hypothetical protein